MRNLPCDERVAIAAIAVALGGIAGAGLMAAVRRDVSAETDRMEARRADEAAAARKAEEQSWWGDKLDVGSPTIAFGA